MTHYNDDEPLTATEPAISEPLPQLSELSVPALTELADRCDTYLDLLPLPNRPTTKAALVAHVANQYPCEVRNTQLAIMVERDGAHALKGRAPRVPLEGEVASTVIVDDADDKPIDWHGLTRRNPIAPKPAAATDKAAQLATLLGEVLGGPQVDEAKLSELVNNAVSEAIKNQTVRHEIVTPALPDPINVGIQHKHFDKLLKVCNARLRDGSRLNAWLVGPASSGKSTAAESVAKALNLPFYVANALDQPYKLTGYRDSNGHYLRTAFREAWENGGIFLFDEVDRSNPSAVLEFNAALANGMAVFPDVTEPIKRHPDCVIIAGANTAGQGGTVEYNGAAKQDAAFLDRFIYIDWPLDETLERALCTNIEWVSRVQSVRQNVKSAKLRNHLVSARATIYGEALLAAGLDQETVEGMTLRKGISDQDWASISA